MGSREGNMQRLRQIKATNNEIFTVRKPVISARKVLKNKTSSNTFSKIVKIDSNNSRYISELHFKKKGSHIKIRTK